MPYQSDQQRKWAHTAEGMKALGGKSKVAEWDKASKGLRLPKKKKKGWKHVMEKVAEKAGYCI